MMTGDSPKFKYCSLRQYLKNLSYSTFRYTGILQTFYIASKTHNSRKYNMEREALDEDRKSPLVHNAYCFPYLTTFGPDITREMRRLDCSISVQMVSFNHDRPTKFSFIE